jgi:hypothetical protein
MYVTLIEDEKKKHKIIERETEKIKKSKLKNVK